MKSFFTGLTALLLLSFLACKNKALEPPPDDPRLGELKVPANFRISLFAKDVDNARSLAMGEKGTIFVGNRKGNSVYALVDENEDGYAEKKYVIAKGLDMPNGVAFHNGALYIAEVSKIWRIDNVEANLDKPSQPVLVSSNFPTEKHHGWKYIAFGPDGKLYVPVGAPCNICDSSEYDKRYSSITRMNADGSGFEVFAHGVRNTVGFTWHPQTGELWFTENGRDQMGDNVPADELNVAPRANMHFGYPYCHEAATPDPEFNKGKDCSQFVQPVASLTPHGAALGIKFYTGGMFPDEYRNQAFIAEHGSWNRTEPIGYRVMLARMEGNTVKSYEPFIQGWLKDGKAWGRPVDVLQMKDGSLLVSDDYANAVYRITYDPKMKK
ncbi:MAG TPA: sorbosone dehydrogenase family protein [Chitinophagaceae bacterium]|nr:sorbosone dehydrogenase family protein [Chitinophagaceae bacterium]